MKEKFIKKPVLVTLDLDKKMRMEVDTSDYAIRVYYPWNAKMGSGGQ